MDCANQAYSESHHFTGVPLTASIFFFCETKHVIIITYASAKGC